MDLAGDLPVTLVVKAANQRIADQTVECLLGWNIRKLKQHLENVYPSKPKHHQQKIIYSGQLLADHLTLKEVLRQYDSENCRHTVHLVCSPSLEMLAQPSSSQYGNTTDSKTEVRTSSSIASIGSSDSDGFRHRGSRPQNVSATDLPNAGVNPALQAPGLAAIPGMPDMFGLQGMPMGMAGYPYSQEQIAWMQQLYAQYMAQYMQYYGYQAPVPPQAAPVAAPRDEQPANVNAVNNGRANQNMRMNAQGGLEEDDDEAENRDWLDYIYVFFRFLILLSIVYFYSSATRFLAVTLGFLVIYIIQHGWQNWHRQQQRRAQPPQQPEPHQQPQPQPDENREAVPGIFQPNEQLAHDNQTDQADPTGVENANAEAAASDNPEVPTRQEENPSSLEIALRMFSTFFTSLMPTRPPEINAN